MSDKASHLRSDSRRQEYETLVAELEALDQDIAAAREAAPRATHGGLDLGARPERVPRPHGEPVRLADGSQILVRPIEPRDQRQLERAFGRLGALSRYERFRRRTEELTPEQLTRATDADHDAREAFVAVDPSTGDGIGLGGYVRDPHHPERAEVTCTVADAWQERGVGSALLERLAARAREVGIERFTAHLLVGNERARRLLARVADESGESRYGGVVEITARLRAAR